MTLRRKLNGNMCYTLPTELPKKGFTKSSQKEFAIFSTILAAFFLFAYRGYFGLGVLNQGDLLPLYPNWGDYLNAFVYSWSNSNLGFAGSATEAGFFNAVILFVFGNNPLLAQKAIFLATIPTACLTMFIFLSYHLTLRFEKSIISFFYGVNPVTIGLFFGGGVGLLMYYSVFPLLLLFLFKVLNVNGGSSRSIVAFATVLAFAASFDVQASLFVLPFVIAFLTSTLLAVRNLKSGLRIAMSILACFAVFSVLTLPTSTSYFSSLFGYFFGSAPGNVSNYSATSISHDSLVSRIHDDFVFQTYDFLTYAIYITSIMILIALFVRDTRRLRNVISLLLLSVSGILFWQLGINGSDLWLYNYLPVLFALSTLKLRMLLVQSFALVGAFLLEEARARKLFERHSSTLTKRGTTYPREKH